MVITFERMNAFIDEFTSKPLVSSFTIRNYIWISKKIAL